MLVVSLEIANTFHALKYENSRRMSHFPQQTYEKNITEILLFQHLKSAFNKKDTKICPLVLTKHHTAFRLIANTEENSNKPQQYLNHKKKRKT